MHTHTSINMHAHTYTAAKSHFPELSFLDLLTILFPFKSSGRS